MIQYIIWSEQSFCKAGSHFLLSRSLSLFCRHKISRYKYMGKDEFIYIKSSVLSNKLELETRSRAVCYARLVELKNLILWKQFD